MRKILIIIFLSLLFSFIPLTIIWTHHQLVTGLNPFLAVVITPFMLLIAFLIYRLFIKIFKRYISFTPDVLFTIGFFGYLFLFFAKQIFYGNSALDIPLHDSYYVMSYSYPFFFVTLAFAIFAATYYWFDKIFKRQMNYILGYIHFWISFLGTCFLLLPMHYVALAGMPRRYIDYSDSHNFNSFDNQSTFISPLTLLLIIAQLLFAFNFWNSIFKKTK